MPNYNKVILAGHLTRDIEIREINQDTVVGSFGLAVNHKYKARDGSRGEEVVFVDCTVWGKSAETMAQYLSKGSPVLIEGRLKLDQWDDKDSGEKRSKLKVVVESFTFLPSGNGDSEGRAAPASKASPAIDHDDIPFD